MRQTCVLYFGCRTTQRNSSRPCANWHLSLYLHSPVSVHDRQSSVLYKSFAVRWSSFSSLGMRSRGLLLLLAFTGVPGEKDGIALMESLANFVGGANAADPCHVESRLNKDVGTLSRSPRTKPSPLAPCGVSNDGGNGVGAHCKMCANGDVYYFFFFSSSFPFSFLAR